MPGRDPKSFFTRISNGCRDFWRRCEAVVAILAVLIVTAAIPVITGLSGLIVLVVGEFETAFYWAVAFVPTAGMLVWMGRMLGSALEEYDLGRTIATTRSGTRNRRRISIIDRLRKFGAVGGTKRDRNDPFALLLALRIPILPWALALPLSLWWFAHFAAAFAAAQFAESYFRDEMRLAGATLYVWTAIVAIAMQLGANVFLMLAVAALRQPLGMLALVWRYRLLINAAIVGLLLATMFLR